MPHRQQQSDRNHHANKKEQPWGGQKPIITGALGQGKYRMIVPKQRKTEKIKRAA